MAKRSTAPAGKPPVPIPSRRTLEQQVEAVDPQSSVLKHAAEKRRPINVGLQLRDPQHVGFVGPGCVGQTNITDAQRWTVVPAKDKRPDCDLPVQCRCQPPFDQAPQVDGGKKSRASEHEQHQAASNPCACVEHPFHHWRAIGLLLEGSSAGTYPFECDARALRRPLLTTGDVRRRTAFLGRS